MRQPERLRLVESAVRSAPWTEAAVSQLMVATGASRATIYRDRGAILKVLAQEEQAGLEERRAGFLLDVRRVRAEACDHHDYSPAARLLDMECKILGLDRERLPEVEEDDGATVDTSLEGVLREVRRLRRRAMAGDSYVAAEKLLEREHALVEAIQQRDEAERQRLQEHLTEEELVDLVIGSLAGLPAPLRRRLAEAIAQHDR